MKGWHKVLGIGILVVGILAVKWVNLYSYMNFTYSGLVLVQLGIIVSLALVYKPIKADGDYSPSISVLVPVFNEDPDTLLGVVQSIIDADYDGEKEIIVVDDGSTRDLKATYDVLETMPEVKIVKFSENKGNKWARAEGINQSSGEILVFLDSDTYVVEDCLKEIVQPFHEESVGAVSGHLNVYNDETIMGKLQYGWYYTGFRVYRGAEDYMRMVSCCPGALSAYRKSTLTPELMDDWLNGTFIGLEVTAGVDRALTNLVLKDHDVRFQYTAQANTVVPTTFRQYLRQQVRWKKSWIRENVLLASFIHCKGFKSLFFYLSFVLHIANYIVLGRVFFWDILQLHSVWFATFYTLGVLLTGFIYALFCRKQKHWQWRILFPAFYSILSLPLLVYSLLTLYDTSWMTRQ